MFFQHVSTSSFTLLFTSLQILHASLVPCNLFLSIPQLLMISFMSSLLIELQTTSFAIVPSSESLASRTNVMTSPTAHLHLQSSVSTSSVLGHPPQCVNRTEDAFGVARVLRGRTQGQIAKVELAPKWSQSSMLKVLTLRGVVVDCGTYIPTPSFED
jgi:hypothetical protein